MTAPFDARDFAALLFDMDGTILTSIPAVERAWTAWAPRVGVPADPVLHYMHGRRAVDTIRHFAPPGADIAAEAAWLEAREMRDVAGIAAIPGAARFLAALPPERWAVVTSASRGLALLRIRAAGLPLPRVLVSSEDVMAGKPDPEGYLRGARALNLSAADCLVLEDTDAGLQAGVSAGASVLRILGAGNGARQIDAAGIASYEGVTVEIAGKGLRLQFADPVA